MKALESEDFYRVFSPFSESACLGTVLILLAEKPERLNGVRDRKIENYSLSPFHSKPGQTLVRNILRWCFSKETYLKCHAPLKPTSVCLSQIIADEFLVGKFASQLVKSATDFRNLYIKVWNLGLNVTVIIK